MHYHVGRGGQPLGQFTEEEIRQSLDRGTFLRSDLAWREGMAEWKPLDQVFGFAAALALEAPMTALGPAAMGTGLPPEQLGDVGLGVMPTPGTAIASLVLGILSLLLLFVCYFGAALGVPGVICGHMALSAIKQPGSRYQGRGLALAGLITSYAALLLALLLFLFFALIVGAAAASQA